VNAKEFLKKEAKTYRFKVEDAEDGDLDLRPEIQNRDGNPSAHDLIEMAATLMEVGYSLTFMKGTTIHVHAPHRKEHSWDDRGWDCAHLAPVEECELEKSKSKFKGLSRKQLLEKRNLAVQMRDACMGDLYRGINQAEVDEIDNVLRYTK